LKPVNLIPDGILTARAVRRRVRCWSIGGGVGGPLVALVGLVYVGLSLEPTGALSASLEEERESAAVLEEEIASLEGVIEGRMSRLALQKRITETPRWTGLFLLIAEIVGDRAALNAMTLGPVEERGRGRADGGGDGRVGAVVLMLSGRTDSTRTLSGMLLDLEGEAVFSRVDLVSSTSVTRDERGLIGFQIECVIGETGDGDGGDR